MENWLPVEGWEGIYDVSDHGRVRRHFAKVTRILLGARNVSGHLAIVLTANGRRKRTYVHRLVCEAFHGPPPYAGAYVLHWNDDPADNRASNLRWGGASDNANDYYRNSSK